MAENHEMDRQQGKMTIGEGQMFKPDDDSESESESESESDISPKAKSRVLGDEDTPSRSFLFYEDIVHVEDDVWDLYFDGASNNMGCGIGVLIISPRGEHVPVSIKLDFAVTNNDAEYEACLLGLQSANKLGVMKLTVHGDSSLVINQVTGSWKIKSSSLAPYQAKIEELKKLFEEVRYVYLPREENQFADALSKLAALINILDHMDSLPLCVERRSSPAYINDVDDAKESEAEPWYASIVRFKEAGEYPADLDTRGKRALRMLSAQFVKTNDGQLYKKTAQGVLLRCVDKTTSEKVMEEVHDGECGSHMNSHMLVRKIMRLGYYWTTMETDCRRYVRHCHNCQIFANIQHLYQKRIERAFNKKVKPRGINEGDLVLKSVRALLPVDPRGKFKPNWAGPYLVKKILTGGAVCLTDLDGNDFSNPTNLDQLKKYYP
ncbi:uncharacterized protein LOC141617366 [Silene latifolia]|uniref:uncharacterized protein LOC141617366 n=1 Tax=Silene latifolia TaxID=37657 RepID=UPI003D78A889